MSALFWFIGLVLLTAVLFLLAFLRPTTKTNKPSAPKTNSETVAMPKSLEQLVNTLTPLLPEFDLTAKSGERQRIIVYQKDVQCAIIVLSDQYKKRIMNQILIIDTNGSDKQLQYIAQCIYQYVAKKNKQE